MILCLQAGVHNNIMVTLSIPILTHMHTPPFIHYSINHGVQLLFSAVGRFNGSRRLKMDSKFFSVWKE